MKLESNDISDAQSGPFKTYINQAPSEHKSRNGGMNETMNSSHSFINNAPIGT